MKNTIKPEVNLILHCLFEDKIDKNIFTNLDFKIITQMASSHLMLPSLFTNARRKNILKLFPDEFASYLKEIYNLNLNRNMKLIEEVKHLSYMLNNYKINHVFLKGTANIFADIYEDLGERMIGDIDFIYEKKQERNLIDLLNNEGYKFSGEEIFFGRHLERISSEDKLFALEPHYALFNKKNKLIDANRVLSKKIRKNEIFVPCLQHLIEFNILNYQINDHGSKELNFSLRNIYDSHAIIKKGRNKLKFNSNSKYFDNYFYVTKQTGITLKINYQPKKNYFRHLRYTLKKKSKFYNFFDIKFISVKMFFYALPSKLALLITNKKYFCYIIKKLVGK